MALGLVALVALVLGLAAPGSAQAPTTTTVPPAPAGRVALAGQSSWVTPGGAFELRLQVAGAPPGSRVTVQAHPRVAGRIRFEQSIEGRNLGNPLQPAPPPVDLAGLGPEGAVALSYPVLVGGAAAPDGAGPPLRLPSSTAPQGVYPLSVRLVDADGRELDAVTTHLVVLPAAGTREVPLATSLVVPVAAPTNPDPGSGSGLATPDAQRLATLIGALERGRAAPVSLAPSPDTLEALVLHDREHGSALAARLRAATAGDQVVARTYVPVDEGSWAEAARTEADADQELDAQLVGAAVATEGVLGTAPDRRTWLVGPSTTPEALAWLGERGVAQVVVPEAQVDAGRDTAEETASSLPFTVEAGDGDRVPALMADATVASRLTATDDPVLNGHLLLANLAVLQGDRGNDGRGIVVSLPDDLGLPAATWDVVLQGLATPTAPGGAPLVEPLAVDALFARVTAERPRSGEAYRHEAPHDLGDLPAAIAGARADVASLRTMVGDALPPVVERQLLVAASSQLDRGEQLAVLGRVHDEVGAQLAGVVAPDDQQVTITDDVGNLTLVLENQLPHPAEVLVDLGSTRLEFPDGTSITATLAPQAATRLEFTVVARASGAFPLDVEVRTPDGALLVASTRYTVRSTAISGLGLALAVGAGLFLAVWWARHFRSIRRARRLVGTNHPSRRPAPDPTTPAGPGGSATLPPAAPQDG